MSKSHYSEHQEIAWNCLLWKEVQLLVTKILTAKSHIQEPQNKHFVLSIVVFPTNCVSTYN